MNPREKNQKSGTALELGSLKFNGKVGDLLERLLNNRIRSEAGRRAYQETEDAFRNRLDDASGIYGIWQGEFWGKWILGAVRSAQYEPSIELREFIRRGVHTLLDLQEPSGYLGTYRDPLNFFAADPRATEPLLGWPCDWNWNIWCRKYTLWGLIEAGQFLGDTKVIQAACALANDLIDTLHRTGTPLRKTGTFAGIPSCSILKPMVLLYRETREDQFLDFAKEIAADWRRADHAIPNLIANALSDKPVHQWYPEPPRWAKVYETLSCFDGLLMLFRETGDQELLQAAIHFHSLLKRTEYNPLFSVGFNDIFFDGSSQINAISEPCDVIHWMRLCYELFLETDDAAYLDDFEFAFWNPFLAGICRDGCWGARGVRSHGRHLYVFEQAKMRHNHCCVNNLPRGFLNGVQATVTRKGEKISINLYPQFEAEFPVSSGLLKLQQTGDCPGDGEVCLKTDYRGSAPLPLRLRLPLWATSWSFGGNAGTPVANGRWLELNLLPGQAELTLQFERRVEIRHYTPPQQSDQWYRQRWQEPGLESWFRQEAGSTLSYGPLLLARSKIIGNHESEIAGPALPTGFEVTLRRRSSDEVRFAFDGCLRLPDGTEQHTTVCDYASAGDRIQDDPHLFSIFF